MNKKEITGMLRAAICKASSANDELWECIGNVEDAVATMDKNKSAGILQLGMAVERLKELAQETFVASDYARAARKYELEEFLTETKDEFATSLQEHVADDAA